jgi:hypothetical protein
VLLGLFSLIRLIRKDSQFNIRRAAGIPEKRAS